MDSNEADFWDARALIAAEQAKKANVESVREAFRLAAMSYRLIAASVRLIRDGQGSPGMARLPDGRYTGRRGEARLQASNTRVGS